jgi:hypothetical protein
MGQMFQIKKRPSNQSLIPYKKKHLDPYHFAQG